MTSLYVKIPRGRLFAFAFYLLFWFVVPHANI